ncbi:MAG: carboxymuconolactone decarboxylase family protein [Bacteroidota bacterium]
MQDPVKEFNEYRDKMNQRILEADNKVLKRIFNLDTNAYLPGELSVVTKEMIGLATSMVLKCDDCVYYHLQKCYELGVSKNQIFEVFSIANLVGGTIVIPHLRKAVEFWDALENNNSSGD